MKKLKLLLGLAVFLVVMSVASNCAASLTAVSNDGAPLSSATADSPKFRVETVAANLEVVCSIVFAADCRMYFTERTGRVRIVEN